MTGTAADATAQLERARRLIAELRGKLAEVQAAATPPVAIVGMACRFPGSAHDLEGFRRMVEAGASAVTDIPPERARYMAAGSLKPAALLDDIADFDAAFFNLSPREAAQMDPQQRLFLEVAWAALEDAGQTRAGLSGSATAVFVGAHNHSDGYLELASEMPEGLNEFSGLGGAQDVIAGRLAYFLDLRGPAAAVNTACSSALMAVHLACQSLWTRDCRLAVAGGVNLVFGRTQTQLAGLSEMLSPDGRCKTFDARANGYGRGEGCGVVVLKRLADAQADRDRILAVIRGSAVNQDGRSNGLTAPNGLAQRTLMRRVLARAGLTPERVGYVEAHGTGTALGDPIEVEALAEIYGGPSAEAPRCALGSAKANINHLEAAAGVAGLIKAVLALRHRTIPPLAGFTQLNPHISLAGTRLAVPLRAEAWRSEAPRVAAVSSFGWSGVNVHMLVEEVVAAPMVDPARPTLILVSVPHADQLAAHIEAMAQALDALSHRALESFAWTAAARRSTHDHVIAVVGNTPADVAAALRRRVGEPPRPQQTGVGFLVGEGRSDLSTLAAELAGDAGFAVAMGDTPPSDQPPGAFEAGVAGLLARWNVRPVAVAGWGGGGETALALGTRATVPGHAAATEQAARDHLREHGAGVVVRLDALTGSTLASGSARKRLLQVLADLVEAGAAAPAWEHVFGKSAQVVELPAMPFRRRRHWLVEAPATRAGHHPGSDPTVSGASPEWFFDVAWEPAPTPRVAAGPSEAQCLVLGDREGRAGELAAGLRRLGVATTVEEALAADARQLTDRSSAMPLVVLDLRACEARSAPVAAACLDHAADLATLWRGVDASAFRARLWVVTLGAQAVTPAEAPDLAGAPLWGLGRSLGLAAPEGWGGGLLDLDPDAPLDAAQIWETVTADDAEREVALRRGVRLVRRLLPTGPVADGAWRADPTGAYLITGAFGGVGPLLALWLADRGATSLVLAGRSLDTADGIHPSAFLAQRLAQRGVSVRLERVDVGDPHDVSALFDRLRGSGPPLRGLFHAAAAAYERNTEVDRTNLAAAFRPKVDGSLHLDRQTRGLQLDAFVLFSSAAGVFGDRYRASYAAANTFLDALAARRRAQGLPAVSISWGVWGGRSEADPELQFFHRVGLMPMPPEAALDALDRILTAQRRGLPHPTVVAAMDGDRFTEALKLRGQARFLSRMSRAADHRAAPKARALAAQLRDLPASLRRDRITDLVASASRSVLELAPEDALDRTRGFFDLGMNSLMTVALTAELEGTFGLELPATAVMEHPSVAALSAHVATLLAPGVDGDGAGMNHASGPRPGEEITAFRSDLDSMTDEAVAAALAAELASLDTERLG